MERRIFICDCNSLEHQVAFWYDEDEKLLYIEPHLITHDNFFKRIWIGLKYVFGYRSRFGEFDEVVLSIESQRKLREMLNSQP